MDPVSPVPYIYSILIDIYIKEPGVDLRPCDTFKCRPHWKRYNTPGVYIVHCSIINSVNMLNEDMIGMHMITKSVMINHCS